MRRLTLFVLIASVVGLLWLRSQHDEELLRTGAQAIEEPLLPGLQPASVQRIRIEHLERGIEVLLERDPYGRWFLSEPIAYPAEGAVVEALLSYLSEAFGPQVAAPDLAALSLAPPRVVVKLEEEREGQPTRNWRVEIGAVDLDAAWVFARVPEYPAGLNRQVGSHSARVTRVVRSLETTLDRNPNDYRQRSCTTIPFQRVAAFGRAGGSDADLRLEVFLDGEVWRRRDEPRVSMDPSGVGFLLRGLTSLRVRRFIEDAPTDVSIYGLDDPRLEFELRAPDGRRELILLSTNPVQLDLPVTEARWFVMRDGFPHVWGVRPNDVQLLMTKTSSLYDYAVVRSPEDGIESIILGHGQEWGLVLEFDRERWWVRSIAGSESDERRPADSLRVGNLISRLVQAELGEYAPAGTFSMGEAPLHLTVQSRVGNDTEAWIGAPWRDPDSGASGRLFLRSGEDLAATAPPELLALFDLTVADLEDRLVLDVDEIDVDSITVTGADGRVVFRRREHAWSLADQGPIDGARAVLLERLLHFACVQWLDQESATLIDPVRFEFSGRSEESFVLGRLADGSRVIDHAGRRALLAEDPLQEDLQDAFLEILKGP